jgi:hypothetical protein
MMFQLGESKDVTRTPMAQGEVRRIPEHALLTARMYHPLAPFLCVLAHG